MGATFDTFQPTQTSSGCRPINTVSVSHGSKLSYQFSAGTAVGRYPERGLRHRSDQSADSDPAGRGPREHRSKSRAGDRSFQRNESRSATSFGTLTLNYPDLLTGLSEAFRPDLTSSALIDIQGDVQSVRGSSATGMVLNDNGNLNLVKFASVSNSTIVGQPVEPPPDPETLARDRPHSVADRRRSQRRDRRPQAQADRPAVTDERLASPTRARPDLDASSVAAHRQEHWSVTGS